MKIGDLYRDREDWGPMIVVGFLSPAEGHGENAVALYHPEDEKRYIYTEEDRKYLVRIEAEEYICV